MVFVCVVALLDLACTQMKARSILKLVAWGGGRTSCYKRSSMKASLVADEDDYLRRTFVLSTCQMRNNGSALYPLPNPRLLLWLGCFRLDSSIMAPQTLCVHPKAQVDKGNMARLCHMAK
jgi:hypothetical protein